MSLNFQDALIRVERYGIDYPRDEEAVSILDDYLDEIKTALEIARAHEEIVRALGLVRGDKV